MVLILCCLLALSSAGCSSQRDDSSVSGAPSDTQSPAGPDSEQGKQDLSQLDVSKYSGFFGKYTTLTDQTTGVPVIDALLPYGWTAQVHSDWSFVSTSNPCIILSKLLREADKCTKAMIMVLQYSAEIR